jgi:sporulation protein YlmC with PRC-barrel domain
MKFTQCIPPALAVALIASPALAQQPQGQPQGQGQTQQTGEQTEQQRQQQEQARVGQQQPGMQQVFRADRIIGQTVRDRQDERIGRINDLALDTQENRITYAVVNRGGMWGIGGEEVAVAWEQIQPDREARVVRVDGQQVQQARQIDRGQWPAAFGDDAAVAFAETGDLGVGEDE